MKKEIADEVANVRWQTARVAKTREGVEKDKFIRALRTSLNNAVTRLAVLSMSYNINDDSKKDDRDNANIINNIMIDFDRIYNMIDNEDERDIGIAELVKKLVPSRI